FCIDATEVSNAQYAQFLAGGSPTTALCSQSNHTPTTWPAADNLPVVGVDWCDAYDYCAWADKHLCGAVDGGHGRAGDYTNADVSLWYRACTKDNDGLHVWPFGDTYDGQYCNGLELDAGKMLPVGSLPRCVG